MHQLSGKSRNEFVSPRSVHEALANDGCRNLFAPRATGFLPENRNHEVLQFNHAACPERPSVNCRARAFCPAT